MTLGHGLLWLGVVLGVVATLRPSRLTVGASAIAMSASVASLFSRFWVEDWTNGYVVSTTRPGLSLPVRLAGLWGGAEGSLLLFTALVAIAAWIVRSRHGRSEPVTALAAGYGIVLLIAANPFETFDAPAVGGLGLQPVLEHPAMVWHPPILYLGLVGVIVPAMIALGAGDPRQIRTTTGAALALLTAGLATGAAWAHAELGWGGFWAWDPIESAGLVAWLAAAATLHQRFDARARIHRAMFALPALAAVWATTLTRAGLTGSVHSFADRPGLRAGLLVVALGWSAGLAWVAGVGPSGSIAQGRPGRALAAGVLVIASFFVALGTYEPAVEQAIGGDAVAIAGVFFSTMLWPLVMLGAAVAVRSDRKLRAACLGAAVGVAVTPWVAGPFGLAVGAAGGAVAAGAIAARVEGRAGWVAHAGIGVVLVGIAGTVASTSTPVVLAKDTPTEVDRIEVIHRGLDLVAEPNRDIARATIEVDGATLRPELVVHRLRNVITAEAATRRSLFDETQVILSDGTDDEAEYRINRTPRLNLVWFGAALTAVGLLPLGRVRRRREVTPEDRTLV